MIKNSYLFSMACVAMWAAQAAGGEALEQARQSTAQRVQAMVEELESARPVPGTAERRISELYASYMDASRIEALGTDPVLGDLRRIEKAKTPTDIAALFGQGNYIYAPLEMRISADPQDPSRYAVALVQSGLDLPQRDVYFGADARSMKVRDKYIAFLTQVLSLLEMSDAAARAKGIMAFETELARISRPTERDRNAAANNRRWSRAELKAHAPGFDWDAYLESQGVGKVAHVYMGQPDVIQGIAQVIGSANLQAIKDYLSFSLICTWASVLPEKFYQAQFDFYGRVLRGEKQLPTRAQRGAHFVSAMLPQDVGEAYVQRYVPWDLKRKVEALSSPLLKSLGARDNTLGRQNTDALVIEFGYPLVWPFRSTLELTRDEAFQNAKRIHQWEWQRQLARLEQPLDKIEWDTPPHATKVAFDPVLNRMLIPAGLLQSPVYDPAATDAVNTASLSALIREELARARAIGPRPAT